eukprot:6025924-Amphidinium_carterae.1
MYYTILYTFWGFGGLGACPRQGCTFQNTPAHLAFGTCEERAGTGRALATVGSALPLYTLVHLAHAVHWQGYDTEFTIQSRVPAKSTIQLRQTILTSRFPIIRN